MTRRRLVTGLGLVLIGPMLVAVGSALAASGDDIGGLLMVLGLFVGAPVLAYGYFILRGQVATPFEHAPGDPLLGRLETVPLVRSDVGPLVDDFVVEEGQTGLARVTSGGDIGLGGIGQYQLQLSRSRAWLAEFVARGRAEGLSPDAIPPSLQWLRQLVVLLKDEASAARWLADRSARLSAYADHEVGGFRYGHIEVSALGGLGDEAQYLRAPNADGPVAYVDSFVILRRGRIFVSLSTSTINDLDMRAALVELASRLVTRVDALLASDA